MGPGARSFSARTPWDTGQTGPRAGVPEHAIVALDAFAQLRYQRPELVGRHRAAQCRALGEIAAAES